MTGIDPLASFSEVGLHVLYKIANATVQHFPFPHLLVPEVFPRDFYAEMRKRLPPKEAFATLKSLGRTGYDQQRYILQLTPEEIGGLAEPFRRFWGGIATWMLGPAFGAPVLRMFDPYLKQRFGVKDLGALDFYDEALLVQDYTTYSLGPHTDTPSKVLSFLFYLPADDSRPHLGTSMYVPKDPAFTCRGGPHHKFEPFRRVVTMPYVPNTLFAFLKTDNSFHGVEPVTEEGVRRDLLLYDIRVNMPGEVARAAPAGAGAAPVRFSF